MSHEDLLERISIDPQICGGEPFIRGHRTWVSLMVDDMAFGMTPEDILGEYPQLRVNDIRACVAHGSDLTRERTSRIGHV